MYTEAQAIDGEGVFTAQCATCHGEDLAGREQAPALAGGAFGEKWRGATLKKMFEKVQSMPPTKPGSLTAKEYVDVLAYLLSASEVPAGDVRLIPDGTVLGGIVFSPVRPQQ